MKLIIAEKPSLGKAIATYLKIVKKHPTHYECSNGYICTWLFGHMLELATPEKYNPDWKNWVNTPLPMRPKAFIKEIRQDSGVKSQVKAIKALLAQCDEVIHAGDPDREGQLLVDELLDDLKNTKPVQRIWLSAIDDKSIAKAFTEIKSNSSFIGYKKAAEIRQQADWLIGYNLTRAFTQKYKAKGYDNVISIGRVQTPTLDMIVKRDNEIANFVAKDFYELNAKFKVDATQAIISSNLILPDSIKEQLDENNHLLDSGTLNRIVPIIAGQQGSVSSYKKQTKTTSQPLLFNLSKLQSIANKKYGYSAQFTLDIAQMLYENKLISYPRSDCEYLPESQFSEANEILTNILQLSGFERYKLEFNIKSKVWNDKKVSAHHAIIPTALKLNNESSLQEKLNTKQQKVDQNAPLNLYKLICVQYITQFYPEFKYDEVEVIFDIKDTSLIPLINTDTIEFKTVGRTTINIGWKSVFNNLDGEDKEIKEQQVLPVLAQGQSVTCIEPLVATKTTQKPKPYTEGTLIEVMANIHNKIPELVKQLNLPEDETSRKIKEYKSVLKETAGLGTEATRANIIQRLKQQEYIQTEGKNIVSTTLGKTLIQSIDSITKDFGWIKNPLTTAEFEQDLTEVANGQLQVEAKFWQRLDPELNKISNFVNLELNISHNDKANCCLQCSSANFKRLDGKSGKYWRCFDCNTTFKDINSKPTPNTPKVAAAKLDEKCPQCNSDITQRRGKFGLFKSCSKYPTCTYKPRSEAKKPAVLTDKKCPSCEDGVLAIRTSSKGEFLGCNKFPQCKHIESIN